MIGEPGLVDAAFTTMACFRGEALAQPQPPTESHSNMRLISLILIALLAFGAQAQQSAKKTRKPNPAMQPIEDVAGLPRVLLIGDSISIGYTLPVRKLLAGKANVHRPLTNCGPTTRGLEGLDAWLGEGKWDVIHFNWGLHDLKYMGAQGQNLADPNAPDSHQQVPIKAYEANIGTLVARLQKTGATLIWRSTTPVPEGAKGRVVGDAAKYNAVAKAIMDEHGIAIDDHYSLVMNSKDPLMLPANVHFSSTGSQRLAEQAVAAITKALQK
jgi:hypothetical protein